MMVTIVKNSIDWITSILFLVGGLNWGLVGLLNFDLVAAIFGKKSYLTRIVYSLMGLATLHTIYIATGDIPEIFLKEKIRKRFGKAHLWNRLH
jgi:uncharacterized protein